MQLFIVKGALIVGSLESSLHLIHFDSLVYVTKLRTQLSSQFQRGKLAISSGHRNVTLNAVGSG